MSKTKEQPLLEYAAIQGGIYAERLATLGNLVRVLNASIYDAHVLRYVYDRGGCERAIELPIPQMAESPWIHCSEKTVRRSLDFWEIRHILEIGRDRRDERGCQLPHSGRLCWSSVLQQLLGEGVPSPNRRFHRTAAVMRVTITAAGPVDSLSLAMDSLSLAMDSLSLVMDSLSLAMDSLSLAMDRESTGSHPFHAVLYACVRAPRVSIQFN